MLTSHHISKLEITLLRHLLVSLCLLTPIELAAQSGDPTVSFDDNDQAMNSAMSEAVRTFPVFLGNATDANGASVPSAFVKVSFDVADGTEIIWVGPFVEQGGGQFVGALANRPNYMPGLNAGDTVEFTTDMVRDWAIQLPDGLLWGHYTTRQIAATLSTDQAAQIMAALSETPVPDAWE